MHNKSLPSSQKIRSQSNPLMWHKTGKCFLKYGIRNAKRSYVKKACKNLEIALALDSKKEKNLLLLAKAYFFLGKKELNKSFLLKAKDNYEKCISLAKDKKSVAKIYLEYGKLYLELYKESQEPDDIKKAILAFKKSLLLFEKVPSSLLKHLGQCHFKIGLLINSPKNYLQAISYFKRLKTNPSSQIAECYTQLYISTSKNKYFQEAERFFSLYLEKNSKNLKILLRYSQLLAEVSKTSKSIKKIKTSIQQCRVGLLLSPDHPSFVAQLTESLALLGNLENDLSPLLEAETEIIKAIFNHPYKATLWHAFGCLLLSLGSYFDDIAFYKKALQKFKTALLLKSKNAETWHALALCYEKIGIKRDDEFILKKAFKSYLKAMRLKSLSFNLITDFARLCTFLGELKDSKHFLNLARYYFELSFQIEKDCLLVSSEALYYYAHSLDLLAEKEENETLYASSLKILKVITLIDPDFPSLHLKMAMVFSHLGECLLSEYSFRKAFYLFKIAAKKDKENDVIFLEWGLSLLFFANELVDSSFQEKYFREAETKLKIAVFLGNQQAYYYLACLYSLTGNLDFAMKFLEKAEKADTLPNHDEVSEDEWLERLKATEFFFNFLFKLKDKD